MLRIIDNSQCCGCGLCASQCPTSCIDMKPGKLGHLYPDIDNKKCINCGLCQRICPSLHPLELTPPQHAYAAWAKDESDYKSSTSGGASSVIAQHIISQGGVVYGCAVLQGAIVEHIRIDKKEDLYRIKGSKYVQSSIIKVLPQIKQDIKENRTVLFLGTPCQIAAVRKLFTDIPNKLYLVDLVCHGTPSQKSLHNYLKRSVPLAKIDNISFRSEEGYIIKAFSGGQLIYSSSELWSNRYKDHYYNSFFDGFSFRESCYQCRYASPHRVSDISIGDFWGLGKETPCDEIPEHEFGISLILPNTRNGLSLFHEVSTAMNVFERPISEAISGNNQLQHPKEKSKLASIYHFLQPVLGDKIAYDIVRKLMSLFYITRRLLKK